MNSGKIPSICAVCISVGYLIARIGELDSSIWLVGCCVGNMLVLPIRTSV